MEENMIEITGVDLREFIKAAYDLSSPQGMGFIHFQEGGLDDETVDAILEKEKTVHLENRVVVSMDYVHGRAVKMAVLRDGGKLFIRDDWFDHSPKQLADLLNRVGVSQ